jgi:RNase P protein component
MPIFGLLGTFWKPLVGLLVIGGVVFYWYYLTSKIENQALQIVNLKSQAADLAHQRDDIKRRCEENTATLKKALEDQNANILAFQGKAEEMEKRAAQQQKITQTQKQQYDKRLEALRQEQKPATCEGSIKFLIEEGRKATWIGQ